MRQWDNVDRFTIESITSLCVQSRHIPLIENGNEKPVTRINAQTYGGTQAHRIPSDSELFSSAFNSISYALARYFWLRYIRYKTKQLDKRRRDKTILVRLWKCFRSASKFMREEEWRGKSSWIYIFISIHSTRLWFSLCACVCRVASVVFAYQSDDIESQILAYIEIWHIRIQGETRNRHSYISVKWWNICVSCVMFSLPFSSPFSRIRLYIHHIPMHMFHAPRMPHHTTSVDWCRLIDAQWIRTFPFASRLPRGHTSRRNCLPMRCGCDVGRLANRMRVNKWTCSMRQNNNERNESAER